MEEAVRLEMLGEVGVFRLSGRMRFDGAVEVVREAIESGRAQGIGRMVIVTSGLVGFGPPALGDRAYMSRRLAAACGTARVALVARPELIDPEKFGVILARSYGANADVFHTEAEALAWLASD